MHLLIDGSRLAATAQVEQPELPFSSLAENPTKRPSAIWTSKIRFG
jgi:hypothetical protein